MKKSIIRILLILLIVLTLSACDIINFTQSTASLISSSAPPGTVDPNVDSTEFTKPIEITPEFKIKALSPEYVKHLNSQELSSLATEMLELSVENLSYDDMLQMGHNFTYIISEDPKSNSLMSMAFKSLCNVVDYSKSQGFSLSYLYSWANIPTKDVIFKCYSLVCEDSIWGCNAINLLEKDDAFVVATVFLHNNYLSNDYLGVLDIVSCKYPDVQKLGLSKLFKMSMQKEAFPYTHFLCEKLQDNTYENSILTAENLQEIRDHIMRNRFFDFVDKYSVFCNSSDISVSKQAFDRLLAIAKYNGENNADDIRTIANNLRDVNMANQLLNALESFNS